MLFLERPINFFQNKVNKEMKTRFIKNKKRKRCKRKAQLAPFNQLCLFHA